MTLIDGPSAGRPQNPTHFHFGIITPVGRSEQGYLEDLASSVSSLVNLNMFEVEWVLALDGNAASAESVRQWTRQAADQARVTILNAPSAESTGPGSTRNRALAKIGAPWVAAIDSDDTFDPSGILALLEAVNTRPDLAWAAGRACDVGPDGAWIGAGPEDVLEEGITVRGSFFAYRAVAGRPPFHPSATVVRTDVIRRIGGWPEGWFRTEDSALWSVIDAWHHGVWVQVDVLKYRKHSQSLTQAPSYAGSAPELMGEIAEFIRYGNVNPGKRDERQIGHRNPD